MIANKITAQDFFEIRRLRFEPPHLATIDLPHTYNMENAISKWIESNLKKRYFLKKAISLTKSNKIGYVASYPIPEVVRGINSAYLAAKAANPNVEFKVIWIFTWYDPAKEADAAKTLIQQGADVIMQHVDSSAIMTVAEEAGVYAFGQASDMSEFGPNAHLTAIINGWAPYYVKRVQQAMDGTWKGGEQTFDGIGAGMVIIGNMSDKIPANVRKEAQDLADGIASGDIHPFTGPVNKQDGSPWLASGETADIGTLLGMNFYVEGIEGDIPQ